MHFFSHRQNLFIYRRRTNWSHVWSPIIQSISTKKVPDQRKEIHEDLKGIFFLWSDTNTLIAILFENDFT